MLKISIIEGRQAPQTRTTKNGIRYFQEAYAHLGGAFPEQVEIPLRNASEARAVGDYELDVSSFRVGRFKNLEVNPFELNITPLKASPEAAKR